MNILILSAGGPAAVGVIKSLRDMNFDGRIIAIDCDDLSVGFHLADDYYIVPPFTDYSFITRVCNIIKHENIDLILPTGKEIIPISNNIELFKSIGVKAFMSYPEAINLCNDKYKFYKVCKNNYPLPITSLDYNYIGFPLFAKPRIELGGSRGAVVCEYMKHISTLDKTHDYIYQEYLPGQEYTIDVLCDMKSNPLTVIPRKRLQTKGGISTKGKIIRDGFIEETCSDICGFLELKGPICIQMKEDERGLPKFIEINPRFGGGTYFTTLAGINFCKIIIDIINEEEFVIPEPKPITILRYFEEIIV